MDNKEAVIKQIIVVTDGQSNVGGDPIAVAREANKKNIIVNTIGIVDEKQADEKPLTEIQDIAEAGGGTYEYTCIDDLYQTMQSVTYKTVNKTIQDAVNKQLKEIIGENLDDMAPVSRSKLLQYIDSYSDEVVMQCCILMDTSGSMAKKIQSARHSILDLMDTFKARKGRVDMALIAYPGEGREYFKLIHNFNDNIETLESRLYDIKTRGTTPTAPALDYAIKLMEEYQEMSNEEEALKLEDAIG
ncbi:Ca-activated chloride channel family protein [Natronincola peptidivorans]|uniref:Ca-activated chloride channel family protein n=1 Tax=Natronincola peptidivorans TaxID=426128 RepID=A0A1I0AHW1_9FIRM|nr:VWA domain-containing protein [Natronincola peptidivorans]SES93873.1 Ca-activated chloride channel family protein [Natronincola peptidivorans]